MANNLGLDPFPDPIDHLGPPVGHFGFSRRYGVAGGERVTRFHYAGINDNDDQSGVL